MLTLLKIQELVDMMNINEYFVNDINYTNTFFKMGINHGQNANNDSYEYVILPGSSEAELENFAKNNTIEVVRNDTDVQAIKDSVNGIFAMNVWTMDPSYCRRYYCK